MLYMLYAFAADRLRREDGATAVEYGIMVALIALIVIGAVTALGAGLAETFQNMADQFPLGGG